MTPAELFQHSRREFLRKCGMGLGATAMALTLATRNESVTGVQRIPPFVLLNSPPLAALA